MRGDNKEREMADGLGKNRSVKPLVVKINASRIINKKIPFHLKNDEEDEAKDFFRWFTF